MSHDLVQTRVAVYPAVGAAITTDLVDFAGATGVVAVMNFGVPIQVLRAGITVDNNEALDVGAGFTLTLKKYLKPGDSTSAVTLGTISSTADVAAGGGLYNDFSLGDTDGETAEDSTTRYVAPQTVFDTTNLNSTNAFILDSGEQLVWDLTDAADTAGKGQVWVQYVERPFDISDTGFTEVTS